MNNNKAEKNLKLLLGLAFLTLGFLIGTLVGMTSASVVSSLIPLLFAFGGGSAVAFLRKLDREAQRRASIAILYLSIGCIIGVYSGIIITENQFLSPKTIKETTSSRDDRTYIRSNTITKVNYIDAQLEKGNLTTKEAYEQLKHEILKLTDDIEVTDKED